MPAAHLILFTRAPVAGTTKTRLAATVGAEAARDFHVACLQDAIEQAMAWRAEASGMLGREVRLHAAITPEGSQANFARAGVTWPPGFALRDQGQGTLGERMHRALDGVLRQGPGVALLIGTDVPLLRYQVLTDAVRELERGDVVFGPTADGGYYLIGLHASNAAIFAQPTWSHGHVLSNSLSAAAALGLRSAQIEPLVDVDVIADAAAVLADPLAATLAERRAVRLLREWQAAGRLPALQR